MLPRDKEVELPQGILPAGVPVALLSVPLLIQIASHVFVSAANGAGFGSFVQALGMPLRVFF